MDPDFAKSFGEFIKKEDEYEKTPAGVLLKTYMEANPELNFFWIGNIKCVGRLDSKESIDWSEYLLKEGHRLQGSVFTDELGPNSLKLTEEELRRGQHLVIANWYYNNCYSNKKEQRCVALRNLSRFECEHRERILKKLERLIGVFPLTEDEKEAICAYFLIRRSDKFKHMFIANKLLALKVINRYAAFNEIRFEDSEAVLRQYTYLV
jgi:hypothetical protein